MPMMYDGEEKLLLDIGGLHKPWKKKILCSAEWFKLRAYPNLRIQL